MKIEKQWVQSFDWGGKHHVYEYRQINSLLNAKDIDVVKTPILDYMDDKTTNWELISINRGDDDFWRFVYRFYFYGQTTREQTVQRQMEETKYQIWIETGRLKAEDHYLLTAFEERRVREMVESL